MVRSQSKTSSSVSFTLTNYLHPCIEHVEDKIIVCAVLQFLVLFFSFFCCFLFVSLFTKHILSIHSPNSPNTHVHQARLNPQIQAIQSQEQYWIFLQSLVCLISASTSCLSLSLCLTHSCHHQAFTLRAASRFYAEF